MTRPKEPAIRKLALAAAFGFAFGFLLQKGGVAKYNVLIGALLLEDFTVVKVMVSAIIVGMVGIAILHARGMVKLHLQPTRFAAQSLGGILFGVGFALLAYCPGTGAAALGQGNWDAIFGVIGLMAGSFVFAEVSAPVARILQRWGEKPNYTLPVLFHARRSVIVVCTALMLIGVLLGLEYFVIR